MWIYTYHVFVDIKWQKRNREALNKAGFDKVSGGRHDVWKKDAFPPIPFPRHKGDTAEKILKAAGIK